MLFIRQVAIAFLILATTYADQQLDELKKSAAAGDVDSQITVGNHYRDGTGVKQNYASALRWYRKAAEQGEPLANYHLAQMYLEGQGVNQIWSSAVRYFKRAAEKGHTESLYELGLCYFSGKGVKQSYSQAIQYWKKAASQDHIESTWRLALLHASGESIPKNWKKAEELLEPLVALKHLPSMILLGEIEYRRGNKEKAMELWKNARWSGSWNAQALIDLAKWRDKKPVAGEFAYVEVDHIYQGHNNCVPTSVTMLMRLAGSDVTPYQLKQLCSSPRGAGTDWSDTMVAAQKLGVNLAMGTFTLPKPGFLEGVELIQKTLDEGKPVMIDITYTRWKNKISDPSSHTLLIVGYHKENNVFVLKNPFLPSPGIELVSSYELAGLWRSDSYSLKAKGTTCRPIMLLR